MKEHSIITIPNKILSEVTKKVTSFDSELENKIKIMRGFLKTHDGAGLAANQIGLDKRVIVIEFEDEKEKNSIPFRAFINPEIVESCPEKDSLEEGCLSVPQIELPVERAKKIKIRAQNLQGKKIKLAAKDVFARILQHEIDHLNGIIFTERVKEKFLRDNPILKKLKIGFFGSGNFAAPILEGLILLGLKLTIVTEKSKPAGRKQKLKQTPVAEMARKFDREVLEVETLMDFETATNFDLLICADFGKIIPENILKLAKIAALNLHPSLLPKYRGATPVQTAIFEGAQKTGVTIIKMNQKIDQGAILAQVQTDIYPNDNTWTLTRRLATLALKLTFEVLPLIIQGELRETKQAEKDASVTRKFQKKDGEIDWQEPIEQIERQIRAFYPWPGSYTFVNNQRLLIHQAHLAEGKLVLDLIQKEGGRPMKWQDFLRGFRGPKPTFFDKTK